MTSACRISNLHVAFGKTEILHGVSLEAPARGVTMLTGRSGSGKTTLLRALNRLNETFPGCRTTGSVEIDLGRGMEDIYGGGRPVSELRRLVGMVFQTPNVLPVSVQPAHKIMYAGLNRNRLLSRIQIQIGNAVPVELARVVAASVACSLREDTARKQINTLLSAQIKEVMGHEAAFI